RILKSRSRMPRGFGFTPGKETRHRWSGTGQTKERQRMTTKRESLSKDERIRRLRLGELKRVLLRRYGHELPDDDAGRADLELLLDVVSFARDARRRMKNIIETWAPWMDTAQSYELVENVLRKPVYERKIKKDDLGAALNLTFLERQALSI